MMLQRIDTFLFPQTKRIDLRITTLIYREVGRCKMFDQLDDSRALGKKTLKEKVLEGAIILLALAVMVGIMLFSFHLA
jgi:hypothetical protein